MKPKPSYLIYWTGKDICLAVKELNDISCNEYLDRLLDIIANGLWMNFNSDSIEMPGGHINMSVPMTCFTELRLTQSSDHTARYGLLGIGFKRNFVIKRQGRPVFYFKNTQDDPFASVVSNILETINETQNMELIEQARFLFGLIKPMSELGKANYLYLNESEWRILHHVELEESKLLSLTGQNLPFAKIPFSGSDISLIVFPDKRTKTMAIKSEIFRNWLTQTDDPPILLTNNQLNEL